ncbi:hypothetical protein LIA77_05893 [Sarocladium implicatum]|nr:hypothetical protein LIA77_05893 [Sarocladium implicatum]
MLRSHQDPTSAPAEGLRGTLLRQGYLIVGPPKRALVAQPDPDWLMKVLIGGFATARALSTRLSLHRVNMKKLWIL